MTATSGSKDIHLVRLYDAPLRAVWDAWTDPAQTAQWWGPRGFTLTTHSKDLRTGGNWSYTMHGPDGTDYPNTTLYLDVTPLAKLVYDHGGHADRPPMFRVTVLFAERDGKTRMDMTMHFADPDAARQAGIFIKQAGGNATWDRLAEFLAQENIFVIHRSVDAPLPVVFSMWTSPEHIPRWLPPAGFAMQFKHADIRTGGDSLFSMSAAGMTLHAAIHYEEVRNPDRIVYTQQFRDADGQVARHPLAPTWPETMRVTVELTAEGPRQTRITLTTAIAGAATAEEVATFVAGRAGMTLGWSGSFDQLDTVLATAGSIAQVSA